MEVLANSLPAGTTWAWSGLSLQEKLASGQALSLYAVSILVVFLCLAALYESWSVLFSVILVIPLGLLGAALAAWMRDLNNDVYFQVALLTTIGLSSKNAILIVEFAEAAVAGLFLESCGITRCADSFTPNHHDLAGVYCGGNAAGDSNRRRGEQPHRHWYGHYWRYADRYVAGYFLCSSVFVLVKRLFAGKSRRQE